MLRFQASRMRFTIGSTTTLTGRKLVAAALKIACSWKDAQIIIRLITFSEWSVSEVFFIEESNAYTRFSAN